MRRPIRAILPHPRALVHRVTPASPRPFGSPLPAHSSGGAGIYPQGRARRQRQVGRWRMKSGFVEPWRVPVHSPCMGTPCAVRQRREPETGVLFCCVQTEWNTFVQRAEVGERVVPRFCRREVEGFMRCGILGFWVCTRALRCLQTGLRGGVLV
jgi:hypothetical protein